jgi:tetratricopeptide (TPR) repeat protein
MGDKQRAAFLLALALSYRDSGDLEGAVRAGHRSLALYASLDAQREQVTLENGLALAYLGLGAIDKADMHAARARELASELGASELEAHITDTMAQIALARRDWPQAIELATTAVTRAAADENRHAEVDGLLTRARASFGARDNGAAIADYQRAAAIAREATSLRQLRAVLAELGDLLASEGRHADAVAAYKEVVSIDK